MFWLFKRKKVADKRAITPCVCDNGNQVADTYTLQDFGSGPSESTTPKMTVHTQDRTRKGYHRLEVPPEEPEDEQHPTPLPVPPPVEEITSSSTESSEDYEREYFGGFTDTEDEEEELTCNVCERSFRTVRRLEQHQQRLRHYGCSICDALFPGLMALELHKETLDHWSDYELRVRELQDVSEEDESEDEPEEHRVYSSKRRDELKRLLL